MKVDKEKLEEVIDGIVESTKEWDRQRIEELKLKIEALKKKNYKKERTAIRKMLLDLLKKIPAPVSER